MYLDMGKQDCYDQFSQSRDGIMEAADYLSQYYEEKLYKQPSTSALDEFKSACRDYCGRYEDLLLGAFFRTERTYYCFLYDDLENETK